ncbi:cyclin-domain-containing protein, partial [Cunninghamella echinulata]
ETSADIIDSIWKPQQQHNNNDKQIKIVCTKGFIYEILKRSKTTYSNLQVCLFYLFRVKHVVLLHMANQQQKQNNKRMDDMISCGRRMFLASLMVASKYLQDKNYRNRAWSRISGLSLNEINAAEFTFLKLINYNLYISKETFDQWYSLLHTYLQ